MVNYENAGEELLALLDKEHLSARDVAELGKILPRCEEELRQSIAESLINADPEEAWPLLQQLAEDDDWLVRTEACQSMGESDSESAAELLLDRIRRDPVETVQVYAVLALGEILARRGMEERKRWTGALEELEETSQSQRFRMALCEALYRAEPQEDRLAVLLEGLQSEDYTIRCSALNGLAAVLTGENSSLIRSQVLQLKESEPTPAVRSTIARIEEKFQIPDVLPREAGKK